MNKMIAIMVIVGMSFVAQAVEPIDVYNEIDVSAGGAYPTPVRIHREQLHSWVTDSDYDTLSNYVGEVAGETRERPKIVKLVWGESGRFLCFTNLVNGQTYEYDIVKLDGSHLVGSFTTEDAAPRCLSVPVNWSSSFVLNARDVGGWPLQGGAGKRTRTGVFFRSSALDSFFLKTDQRANNTVIPDELGIKTEIDLRGIAADGDLQRTGDGTPASMETESYYYEADLPSGVLKANQLIQHAPSVLSNRVRLFQNAMHSSLDYTDAQGNNTNEIARAFHILGNPAYHPVWFHCSAGRDRTGLVAFLVSGLCGVAEADLYRDNMVSSFSAISPLTSERVDTYMTVLYTAKAGDVSLFAKYGDSIAGRVRAYLEYIGVPESDMATVVNALTGETLQQVLDRVDADEAAKGTRTVAYVSGSTGQAYNVHRVASGDVAKAPVNNPTSSLRDFSGWTDEVYDETDGIYKRTEIWTPKNFVTVLFKDPFGTVLASKTIENGGDFTPYVPAAPAGTIITGWDRDISNVTVDTSVTCAMSGINGFTGTAGELVTDAAVLARGGDEVRSFVQADGLTHTYVHVFRDTTKEATFVNNTDFALSVTYLAVGGGGAGGDAYSGPTPMGGGGGGGGGVVGDTAILAKNESWTISVGQGGTSCSNRNAAAHLAGTTTVFCGTTEIAVAPGGGAGGSAAGRSGAVGAAGGGRAAASENTTTALGTFASRSDGITYPMNAGGDYQVAPIYGATSRPALAGAGGGAGARGVSNAVASMMSDHGGRGVYSSITGELKVYGGGGGGGGGYSNSYLDTLAELGFESGVLPGEGANGGGKGGYALPGGGKDAFVFAQSGADGFGGGGGGQVAWNYATAYPKPNPVDSKTVTGVAGGSGVVIVRYDVVPTWTVDLSVSTISRDGWKLRFSNLQPNGGITLDPGAVSYGSDGVVDLSLPMKDVEGKDYFVRVIKMRAFRPNENPGLDVSAIKEVRLGNRVQTVEREAFSGCTSLTNVVPFLPDSVTTLGRGAFSGCPVANKLVLRNVELIPLQAFMNTAFGEAELPGVTNIDYQAFAGNAALSNVVFSAKRVSFHSSDTSKGYGYRNFASASLSAKYYFPGLAPDLPANGSDASGQAHTGTSQMFGNGSKNSTRTVCGSWKMDPSGWATILKDIGKAASEISDPLPARGDQERQVKGKACYWQEVSTKTGNFVWLVDWKSPLEPKHGLVILVK